MDIRCLGATYRPKTLSLFLGEMFMDTRCLRATYRRKPANYFYLWATYRHKIPQTLKEEA
jgi:hypothetical protein